MSDGPPKSKNGEVLYEADGHKDQTASNNALSAREAVGCIIDLAGEYRKRLDKLRDEDRITVYGDDGETVLSLKDLSHELAERIYEALFREIDAFSMYFEPHIDPRLILSEIDEFDVQINNGMVSYVTLYDKGIDPDDESSTDMPDEPDRLPN